MYWLSVTNCQSVTDSHWQSVTDCQGLTDIQSMTVSDWLTDSHWLNVRHCHSYTDSQSLTVSHWLTVTDNHSLTVSGCQWMNGEVQYWSDDETHETHKHNCEQSTLRSQIVWFRVCTGMRRHCQSYSVSNPETNNYVTYKFDKLSTSWFFMVLLSMNYYVFCNSFKEAVYNAMWYSPFIWQLAPLTNCLGFHQCYRSVLTESSCGFRKVTPSSKFYLVPIKQL